jgi:Endomembrane protein 70
MQEDVQEDSGWKLVHGDVFRPPRHTLLLSVLLGSGAQIFMMVGVTTSPTPRTPTLTRSIRVTGVFVPE